MRARALKIKNLDRDRLDVVDKTRRNIFNWRGQFTPQFVEYLLDTYSSPSDVTFDPFCGSGTVLLESAYRGLESIGYEINPAAYAMARFITLSSLPIQERKDLLFSLQHRIQTLTGRYYDLPLFDLKLPFRERYNHLLEFSHDLLKHIKDKNELLLSLIMLFHSERNGKPDLISCIKRGHDTLTTNLLALPESTKTLTACLCDARSAREQLHESVDLIITSPPYINVFNYHQNYRAILEIIGYDLLEVAESEIGSNRKNRGNRFKTVVQYALDMEQSLVSFCRSLRRKGLLIIIVGRESRVRGIPFWNSQMLKELANGLGSYALESEHERAFVNRFGQYIKEDILVLRKTSSVPNAGNGRNVAMRALEASVDLAAGEIRDNVLEAISCLSEIEPSPPFNRKASF